MKRSEDETKLNRKAFSVASSFSHSEEEDKKYWWSKTPEERLIHMEKLRQLNYGNEARKRLQRVLEVIKR